MSLANVFSALGDPTRLELVLRLSDAQRLNVTRLSSGVGVTRQAVSKHLAVLEDAGLVVRQRAGRQTLYGLRREGVAEASAFLARVAAVWDDRLERLRAHVEAAVDEGAPPREEAGRRG